MLLARCTVFEAMRRMMQGAWKPELRRGYGAMAHTMRWYEEQMLDDEEREVDGLWTWAEEDFLRDMVRKSEDETTRIQDFPEWPDLWQCEGKAELHSLRNLSDEQVFACCTWITYTEAACVQSQAYWSHGGKLEDCVMENVKSLSREERRHANQWRKKPLLSPEETAETAEDISP